MSPGHRLGHPCPRLVGQPEGAVGQVLGHVFRSLPEAGDLEVVDRGGAVERQMADPAAVHGVGEERGAAGFHDVPAAHDHHRAALPNGLGPGVDDRAQVGGGEDVG